jgi:hypothetical protein
LRICAPNQRPGGPENPRAFNFEKARLNLAEAFQRDPDLRITAIDDPDLEGIW